MKPVGILYATRQGQTKRIADYLESALDAQGLHVESRNLRYTPSTIWLDGYSAVILAASVRLGRHEPEMIRFVKDHLAELGRMPAAFLSVSLSQAGVELPGATFQQRSAAAASVQKVLQKFFAGTGWRPKRVKAVAGALLYTKYNFLVRFVMKRIALKAGGSTDTSRDHEYTNWALLDWFADGFAKELYRQRSAGA